MTVIQGHSSEIRKGKSKLDHNKIATRYIADRLDHIDNTSRDLAGNLESAYLNAACKDIDDLIHSLTAIRALITDVRQ